VKDIAIEHAPSHEVAIASAVNEDKVPLYATLIQRRYRAHDK
jgi:hypothetical protein